jgi:hypothetical protein
MRFISHVGKKYGDLTVVTDEPGSSGLIRCRCDCGTVATMSKSSVTHGLKKSCGCRKLGSPRINVVGQRKAMLTVLAELLDDMVLVRCDCGREVVRRRRHWYGSKSCGCQSSTYITVGGESQNLTAWAKELRMTRAWASKLQQMPCVCKMFSGKHTRLVHRIKRHLLLTGSKK